MTANEPNSGATAHEQPAPSGREAGGEPPSWTLADRINHLFETIKRPDNKMHTNDEVAAAMKVPGEPQISGAYLSSLRRGVRDNPTKKHLEALARFFSVSPAYFFDDAEFQAIAEELKLLRILKDAGVTRVASRLGGLSPNGLRNIAAIVDQLREIEGLDSGTVDRRDPE